MTHDIAFILSKIEPQACDAYSSLPHDIVAKYSIAISMKRIADFLAACGDRIEMDTAMAEKPKGSGH
jgi:hypothetical protein